ncbi:hypothetical protein K466DRAFT_668609 [Polyporus arcularius HHB13444]|uniref:F-box domain-containing protein n=1 Tax=Polyporus arcularius HHB13444 TaxID=1314778 RepID=A0A5C3NKU4_9APHY|nr:hypothetical protein K466DRAFT_668609 [Polyporus arcularius HHB13444]
MVSDTVTVAESEINAVAVDEGHGSIMELQQELRNIEEPSNSLTPVHSLPDELLAHIFAICQVRTKGEKPYLWLNVIQVCRRWSQVAHSAASLWTTIGVYGHPEWLSHCMVLSKGMPVDIEIRDPRCNPESLLAVLRPHVGIIRSLTVISVLWLPIIEQLLKMGMCSLEKLHMLQFQWPCFARMGPIDVGLLPRLHTLSIAGLAAPSAPSTYKNLHVRAHGITIP